MKRFGMWAIALAVVCLLGCGTSAPIRYYTLSALGSPGESIPVQPPKAATIGVGTITIPDVIDRTQIVTHPGKHELLIAESDRWGGSLRAESTRVLVENLSQRLPGRQIIPLMGGLRIPVDFQIAVEILRWEGSLGGRVSLKAVWVILGDGGRKPLRIGQTQAEEPTGGAGYDALVAAQSRTLVALSRDLAAELDRMTH